MNLFKKTYGFTGNDGASQAVVNRLASGPVVSPIIFFCGEKEFIILTARESGPVVAGMQRQAVRPARRSK